MLITLLITEKCTYKWVQAKKDSIPNDAYVAGRDIHGEPLRVCKIKINNNNEEVIGKADNIVGCDSTFSGKEIQNDSFEVLVASNVEWVSRHGTDPLPEHALIGAEKPGAHIYIGRCNIKDSVQVGKIDYDLYYGFQGQEMKDCPNHEVLVCVQ